MASAMVTIFPGTVPGPDGLASDQAGSEHCCLPSSECSTQDQMNVMVVCGVKEY